VPGASRIAPTLPGQRLVNAAEAEQHPPRSAGGAARRRSVARLAAVQALYQLELNPGLGAAGVVAEFVRHRLGREIDGDVYGDADEPLFADVVRGVIGDRERLDETLSAALSDEWPLGRLDTLLRLILEAGAYELVHRADIPPRVTISEYIGIAYAFFAGKEPGLANGVLDRLARTLRPDDL
jgi:N utilization substance protein B